MQRECACTPPTHTHACAHTQTLIAAPHAPALLCSALDARALSPRAHIPHAAPMLAGGLVLCGNRQEVACGDHAQDHARTRKMMASTGLAMPSRATGLRLLLRRQGGGIYVSQNKSSASSLTLSLSLSVSLSLFLSLLHSLILSHSLTVSLSLSPSSLTLSLSLSHSLSHSLSLTHSPAHTH